MQHVTCVIWTTARPTFQTGIDNVNGGDVLILAALEKVARAQDMSQLARDAGLTHTGLYKALSGESRPSFAAIYRILGALGLQLTTKPAVA